MTKYRLGQKVLVRVNQYVDGEDFPIAVWKFAEIISTDFGVVCVQFKCDGCQIAILDPSKYLRPVEGEDG